MRNPYVSVLHYISFFSNRFFSTLWIEYLITCPPPPNTEVIEQLAQLHACMHALLIPFFTRPLSQLYFKFIPPCLPKNICLSFVQNFLQFSKIGNRYHPVVVIITSFRLHLPTFILIPFLNFEHFQAHTFILLIHA